MIREIINAPVCNIEPIINKTPNRLNWLRLGNCVPGVLSAVVAVDDQAWLPQLRCH